MQNIIYIGFAVAVLYMLYRFAPSAATAVAALTLIVLLINRSNNIRYLYNNL